MKIKKLINKKFENIYDFFEELKKCKLVFSTNREILIQNELINKDFNNTNISKLPARNKRNDNFVVINYILCDEIRTIFSIDESEPNIEFNTKLNKEKKEILKHRLYLINLLEINKKLL